MKIKLLVSNIMIVVVLSSLCNAAEKELGSNKHPITFGIDQTIVDLNKIIWEPLDVPGLPPGAKIAVLRGSLAAGGSESMLKLPPNYRMPSHSHSSDELYVWIQGSFTLISYNGIETNFKGPAYINFPGNAPPHGLTCGPKEHCMLYLRLSRPFDIKYQTSISDRN